MTKGLGVQFAGLMLACFTPGAAAQNAGNSQPPPSLLNNQPFLPCGVMIDPMMIGISSSET